MNWLKAGFSSLLLVLALAACGKKTKSPEPQPEKALRVLGYLFSHNNWTADVATIDFTRITDLNLAFINPAADGQFADNAAYTAIIEKAHQHKVRVYLSLGGGDPPPHLEELVQPAKRDALITAIKAFLIKYNFDGIDVDLENSLINEHYAPFVSALSTALKPANKLMTAALASWNSNLINDATLRLYDYINIMSYDKTGPWNPANAGQHSPYSMAETDFAYYHNTRGIAAEKLLIGLPFYGYGFGTGAPSSLTYKDIVATYPGAENNDMVSLSGGAAIYYNGIGTIKQKVKLALSNKAAGVMIWQLTGDATGSKSLLGAIHAAKAE